MSQVVFAMRGVLDIGPFEVAAAAARRMALSVLCSAVMFGHEVRVQRGYGGRKCKRTHRLPSLRTPATRSILAVSWLQ